MLSISGTDEWRAAHPSATIGLLELSGIDNTISSPRLNAKKRDLEAHLRTIYQGLTRKDFISLPIMAAYERYYKRFDKTYHVLLQVESIVLKGKSLPDVSPLVDSNFMAELDTLILTAGHDVAKLREPVFMDVARVGDQMDLMKSASKNILPNDMIMRDAESICCTIIYGQDNRSPISAQTSHVLYVAYAPVGVPAQAVDLQLERIEENIRSFSTSAHLENRQLISA